MKRKTLDCLSCETKTDIIVRNSNYEDDELVEVIYCPVCSAEVVVLENFLPMEDYDDTEGME